MRRRDLSGILLASAAGSLTRPATAQAAVEPGGAHGSGATPLAVFDVLHFGADPTGIKDSTQAVQQALDACPHGGRVFIPPGTFHIAGAVSWSGKAVEIAGCGPGSILEGDGVRNTFGGLAARVLLHGSGVSGSHLHDFRIQNRTPRWTFDLMNADGTFFTVPQVLATLSRSHSEGQFTFSVNFDAASPRLSGLKAALESRDAGCTAEWATTISVRSSDRVILQRISGRFAQLHAYRCNHSVIADCDLLGANNWATILFENGGTPGVGLDDDWGVGNRVTGNRVRHGGYSGISGMRQRYFVVDGNFVYRCGESGIKIGWGDVVNSRRCYYSTILNNRFVETVYDGIDAYTDFGPAPTRIDDHPLTTYPKGKLPVANVICGNIVVYGDIFMDGQGNSVSGNRVLRSRTGAIKDHGESNSFTGNFIDDFNTNDFATGEHGIASGLSNISGNVILQPRAATHGYAVWNNQGIGFGNVARGADRNPTVVCGPGLQQVRNAAAGSQWTQFDNVQGFRNRLLNGGLRYWQRGTSFELASGWVADGWYFSNGQSAHRISRQSFGSGPPVVPFNPQYFLRFTHSPRSARSGGVLECVLEDARILAGRIVVFSIWMTASKSFAASLRPVVSCRQTWSRGHTSRAPETYPLDVTATWRQFMGTFQVPALPVNGEVADSYTELCIELPADAASYDLDIALAQLELGATPSEFEWLPPGVELQMCQRYFQVRSTGNLADVDLRPSLYKPTTGAPFGAHFKYEATLF